MTAGPPKLAVFWDDKSAPPMQVAEAAAGTCRLIWVIGWPGSKVEYPRRILQKLGEVADVVGRSAAEVSEDLQQFSPSGLITFTEPPQELATEVALHLGLPFHSPRTGRLLSDKLAQRQALQAAGLPVPKLMTLRPSAVGAGGDLVGGTVPFPAVLKPRRGSGGRDTFPVGSEAELRSVLSGCSDEDFVLEEYIADRQDRASRLGADIVSVEELVEDGHVHHVATTGRFPFAFPFRETGHFMPSDMRADDLAAVHQVAAAAAHALGVTRGVLHTEIKMAPGGPRVIEVNGRIGGGIGGLLARLGGPPLFTWAIRLALSMEVGPVVALPASPVAFCRWVPPPAEAARLVSVAGMDRARGMPGVALVRLERQPGDRVDFRQGGMFGHVLTVEGTAPDHQALGLLVDDIGTAIELVYAED